VWTDRPAVVMVTRDNADILQWYDTAFVTLDKLVARPSVIRMRYYLRRATPVIKLTREEVFARDGDVCQYWGDKGL